MAVREHPVNYQIFLAVSMLDRGPEHGPTHQRIGVHRRLILFFRGARGGP
jgi:hypothetical protein